MVLPRMLVTGASGFIGRHLLDSVKERYRVIGLARRSQLRCGAPFHDNISWWQVDIAERDSLAAVFREIRDGGGVDVVVHLAAHYDFTGDQHPEYWRTNVDGLRNVLEECANLAIGRFVFASSSAACQFPTAGSALDESSPADGDHIYAVTKRIGEQMLAEYDGRVPSCIIRFAALFSDWCEYPPLYFFFNTWLSESWNARVLGGKGLSAIPYLHVRDAVAFLRKVADLGLELSQREVLLASGDGATTHKELFELATLSYFGRRRDPLFMPMPLCWIGLRLQDAVGRLSGNRPFERPWMVDYIDKALTIDSRRTRERLGWGPRPRLDIRRRVPFMVEYLKTEPGQWHQRNRAAMKEVHLRPNLVIHRLLEKHQDVIRRTFTELLTGPEGRRRFPSYCHLSPDRLQWRHTVILRHLMNAVRAAERGLFVGYCKDLAEHRFEQGFRVLEVADALDALEQICLQVLAQDPESEGLGSAMYDYVSMTIQFGRDQVEETFERLEAEFGATAPFTD